MNYENSFHLQWNTPYKFRSYIVKANKRSIRFVHLQLKYVVIENLKLSK